MGQGLTDRIVGSVQASTERLLVATGALLPSIVAAAVVLLVAWIVASSVRRLVRAGSNYVKSPTERNLLRQLSYYAVWAVGLFVALDVLGVDARSLATGLGLGGVALGFALKDIVSNLVSGLLILLSHTFEIDDQIVVGTTEGTVERIEVRATHIRQYDGRLVLVPNGEVFMSRVTNNTASPVRRASIFVYLDYDQDLDRAMAVILEAASSVHGVVDAPAPSMRLHDLTPEHMYIEARVWTDSRRRDFMNTASAARVAVVNALKREGIELPNPDQRVVTMTGATPTVDPRIGRDEGAEPSKRVGSPTD